MRTLVGVHDPRGTAGSSDALARAAGTRPEDVIVVGSLALAGAGSPERQGAVTCWLNGDLHNAAEAAADLGLPPETTPSRVVACGYARHGARFLVKLRGSYQFVLWDDTKREALVGQDHLSARAVFYHDDGTRVTFASEISPLLLALPRRPAPDPDIVPRWITDRALPDGLTLYTGVRRLQMGWSLRIDQRRRKLWRTWKPRYQHPLGVDAPEAGAMIRSAVERAVERRLGGGVTGILLSGGFDSGTLAGTAAHILHGQGRTLPAYSAIFPEEAWDESPNVETLAQHSALPSTRIRVTGGTLATAVSYQSRWEVPLPGPGGILDQPLLALAHEAGVRVMFDGQGGDELFAASPYLLADRALRGRFRSVWQLSHRFPNLSPRLEPWQVRLILKELVLKGAAPHVAHRLIAQRRGSRYAGVEWLTPSSRRCADALEDPWAWKRVRGGPRWWRFLAHMLVEARELAGAQDFLRRRAALFGIEASEPLMTDVDLVELMLRMPPDLAFSARHDRALAREAMRGIVPEPIRIGLRKSNYGEFIHRTLAQDDFAQLRKVLAPRDAEVGAFVDLEMVRRDLLEQPPRVGDPGWQLWGQHVWSLAVTELWLRAQVLGTQFESWVQRLDLARCRAELLASPDGALPSAAPPSHPFFHLDRRRSYAYSPASQPNVA
jgi:asparagine synthase (glutamine-hydrolysing)